MRSIKPNNIHSYQDSEDLSAVKTGLLIKTFPEMSLFNSEEVLHKNDLY